jgi:hypothetical protein
MLGAHQAPRLPAMSRPVFHGELGFCTSYEFLYICRFNLGFHKMGSEFPAGKYEKKAPFSTLAFYPGLTSALA